MRQLLRFEHWMIQQFKFDRMSNNLLWVAVIVLPFIFGLIVWLLRLHDRPDVRFIVSRDPAFSGKVAEVYYKEDAFYFRPLMKHLLLNFRPLSATTQIQENDQIVIGHTIFQVRHLHDWTPHLRTIGYYATDRDLNRGVSVGRSIHPEELNNWEMNDIIVKDNSFEPVHFTIFPGREKQYRIKNVGKKGVYIPAVPPEDEDKQKRQTPQNPPQWAHVTTEAVIQAYPSFLCS